MYEVKVYIKGELMNTYLAHCYADAKSIERNALSSYECIVYISKKV